MHCWMRHGGYWGFTRVPVTVGVCHSRRYCNTGYDHESQGMKPSTLKCIGPISKGNIEPNHPSEIIPNSDSRSSNDGRSWRFVQYRVDQSQGQRPRSLLSNCMRHVIAKIIQYTSALWRLLESLCHRVQYLFTRSLILKNV